MRSSKEYSRCCYWLSLIPGRSKQSQAFCSFFGTSYLVSNLDCLNTSAKTAIARTCTKLSSMFRSLGMAYSQTNNATNRMRFKVPLIRRVRHFMFNELQHSVIGSTFPSTEQGIEEGCALLERLRCSLWESIGSIKHLFRSLNSIQTILFESTYESVQANAKKASADLAKTLVTSKFVWEFYNHYTFSKRELATEYLKDQLLQKPRS